MHVLSERDRLFTVAQLDHLVNALEIEMPGRVGEALDLPTNACRGEALYSAIAVNPLILSRLASKVSELLVPKLLNVADLLRFEIARREALVVPEHVTITGPLLPSAGNPRLN